MILRLLHSELPHIQYVENFIIFFISVSSSISLSSPAATIHLFYSLTFERMFLFLLIIEGSL